MAVPGDAAQGDAYNTGVSSSDPDGDSDCFLVNWLRSLWHSFDGEQFHGFVSVWLEGG